jgi:hypothetical protein
VTFLTAAEVQELDRLVRKIKLQTLLDMRAEEPPFAGGVYLLFLGDGVQYVGMTHDFGQRLSNHAFRKIIPHDARVALELPKTLRRSIEHHFIRRFRPPYNIRGNWDDPTPKRRRRVPRPAP